ncbi:MAG: methyltransferase domain-containing protein [Chitinophagales bacterium]|nr:methyltransferase domain-containing protein [Chitinophagales bacterium]
MDADRQLSFDLVASAYDEEFTHTAIGRRQRERVYHFLQQSLSNSPLRILEINAGSGEDAVWLAQRGHHVTATDASPKMISLAAGKSKVNAVENRITCRLCDFDDLSAVFNEQQFDVIFSDFGGLNCASGDELEKLSVDFSKLLKPDGIFIAVIMTRKCLWERIYFLWKGKPAEAFRRNATGEVVAPVGTAQVPAWYYAPAEFAKLFSEQFEITYNRPIGLFIPPSYLNPFFEKRKWLLNVLTRFEKWFSFSFMSNYADHFFIRFQKRSAE